MIYYIDNLKIRIPEDYRDQDLVLQVIVPQPAGRIGGSDTHVLQLAIVQRSTQGLKPVILFCRNPEYEEKLEKCDIGYISCVREKSIGKMLKSLGKIPFLNSIKIIHSHQYNANYLTYALKKKFRHSYGKIPTVMTCHGWIENNIKDKFYTMLDFASYSVAQSLITVCDKDLKRLEKKKKYRHKILANIRNGVKNPNVYEPEEVTEFKKKHSININYKTIAYIGRLAPEKRVDGFITCCEYILKKQSNLNFIVVGSGDELSALKKLTVQKGLVDRINFVGFIDPIDIIYSSIDMLLLTSDTEGTPRCVLEAMAAGIPVVATNVGGLHEIIDGSNGVLVNKGDYEFMANVVSALINNDSKLKEISINAKKTITTKINILDMKNKIDQIYQNIIRR